MRRIKKSKPERNQSKPHSKIRIDIPTFGEARLYGKNIREKTKGSCKIIPYLVVIQHMSFFTDISFIVEHSENNFYFKLI